MLFKCYHPIGALSIIIQGGWSIAGKMKGYPEGRSIDKAIVSVMIPFIQGGSTMNENRLSRRSFLGMTLLGCLSLGGVSFLASCQNKTEAERQGATGIAKGEAAAGDPCADVSGLTEQERQTRVSNGYVGKSTVEGKLCSNCSLFITGKPCGTCSLVKGPINVDGYCTAWIARASS